MATESGFGSKHYVPALRWKAGEIRAFRQLAALEMADGITPLFIIDNYKERVQHENIKKQRIPSAPAPYIERMASELQKTIQHKRAFVDTALFDAAQGGHSGRIDGLATLFSHSFMQLSGAVPVVRITDSAARRLALASVVGGGRGAALRHPVAAEIDIASIRALLRDLALPSEDVDLIVDLGYVTDISRYEAKSEPFKRIEALLASEQSWRTFTVLAGSYPKTTPKGMGPHTCLRHDVYVYRMLVATLRKRGLRLPAFGDYAIINPDAKPTSGSGAGGGSWPIIRYCTGDSWVVWKSERAVRSGEPSPFLELARACVQHPLFMGRQFSAGDEYIDVRATAEKTSGGNSTTFIQNDVNHHLTYTRAAILGLDMKPAPRHENEVIIPTLFVADEDQLDDLE